MENIFYIVVGLGALFALTDWRLGLAIAIFLDCLRDPVRKLAEGEPTLVTYIVCVVWGAAFLNLFFGKNITLLTIRKRFPWLERAIIWYVLALLPGAVLSVALYSNGILLSVLGGISYGAPLLGVALGTALAGDLKFAKKLLQLYVITNSIAMIGSVAEFLEWDWPALGGLKGFEWIRYMPGIIVRLISGFFRSPDIAGFHAANTMMVSAMLLLNRGDKPRGRRKIDPLWLTTLIWSAVPLILCGRRKMLIIPIIFVVAYVLYLRFAAKQNPIQVIFFISLIAAIAAVPLVIYSDEEGMEDHQEYYSTTLTDAAPRLRKNVAGSVLETVNQSGVLGSGLGVATQGAQHLGGAARRDVWQEDGASRLFKELGIPGVGLIAVAAWMVIGGCYREVRKQRFLPLIELQAMFFALVIGNLASFVVSHQHFSGDPANALWVLLFGGLFVGSLSLNSNSLGANAKTPTYGLTA